MKKGIVITGIIVLVVGVLIFGASFALPIKTSVAWYTKVGGISGGGLLLTVIGTYLDELKNKFKSKAVKSIVVEKENIPIDLELSMEKDYQCVNYLSKRFKAMSNLETKKEGLRLLFEAHGLLYKDYYLEEVNSTDNATIAS